jgi:hypothetical protein
MSTSPGLSLLQQVGGKCLKEKPATRLRHHLHQSRKTPASAKPNAGTFDIFLQICSDNSPVSDKHGPLPELLNKPFSIAIKYAEKKYGRDHKRS